MKGFWLAIAWTIVSFFPRGSNLQAEEVPTADEILDKWQAAFQNCRTFQANVTSYEYLTRPDKPDTTKTGQFYYEAPGDGRLQLGDDVFVWLHDNVFVLQAQTERYVQVSSGILSITRDEVSRLEHYANFTGNFKTFLFHTFGKPSGPVFLAPWQDRKAWREKYTFTTSLHDGHVMLTAVATQKQVYDRPREWDVILDPQTNLPWAIQKASGDRSRHVLLFSDVQLNETPPNRNQLLSLDHPEWQVEVFDWLTENTID